MLMDGERPGREYRNGSAMFSWRDDRAPVQCPLEGFEAPAVW